MLHAAALAVAALFPAPPPVAPPAPAAKAGSRPAPASDLAARAGLAALTDSDLARRLAPVVPSEGIPETVAGEEGRRIDAWLADRAKAGFSGVVLAARDGKLLLAKGYGIADREAGTPFRTDTVFSIGSVTKQLTAAAILRLEADRKLSVADSIARFFPEAPADKRGITLHQLLTHTAGLRSDFAGDFDAVGRDEYAARVLAAPLESGPGTVHRYSNSGYSLLAAIVEKASGQPYETYLREKLLLPAGLKETGYRLPAWPAARVAVGDREGKRWGTILEKAWLPDGPGWALRGNGGIHTTLADMARWERVLEGGGGLLPLDARRRLFTPWTPEGPGAESFYGYGWAMFPTPRGGRLVAHDGGNGIFSFDFRRYVDDGVLVLSFSNTSEWKAFRMSEDVARLALGLEPRRPAGEAAAGPIDWSAPGMGRIRGWFDAFNSGDVARMRAFRAENHAPAPGMSEDERDARYRQLYADAGKVTPLGLLGRSDTEATVLVRTSRGEHFRTTFVLAGPDGKISALRIEAGD